MRKDSGFTLLELMIVLTIFGILVTLAFPNYLKSVKKSREAVLKEDLYIMRDVIDKYRADKGEYPATLGALVEEGYLREVPEDPVTGEADWTEITSEDEDEDGGIYDVKSSSNETASDGTVYSEW